MDGNSGRFAEEEKERKKKATAAANGIEGGGERGLEIKIWRASTGERQRAGSRIMAGDNPVARINSQIFQSRDIKGCKLHFWSNAPGGYAVQRFQREIDS